MRLTETIQWANQDMKTTPLWDYCADGIYFMHLDTKNGQAGQSALLESRILYPRRNEKCLQFFYRLNGSAQDKLAIWVKKDDGTGKVRRMEKLHTITADGEHH
ncbi:meprin A subunit alpha-like [Struthio camelus]|uniref:meprin A subunit alpha-like n=1 Tax=Struthio camelus TaxID=8801 RepID=UPI003603C98E